MYSGAELHKQVSFIAYYFHWGLETVLTLPHLERERFCQEISRMNREVSGQAKDIFDVS